MIHGQSKETVLAALDQIAAEAGLSTYPKDVLFSGRRFRQRGAHYGRR